MVKRRRNSAVEGVESSEVEEQNIPSGSPSSPISQSLESRQHHEEDGEEDEEMRQAKGESDDEGATVTAAQEEGGGLIEKRKRKRTRTRKKKPAAQEDSEGTPGAGGCVDGQGSGGGGGGDKASEGEVPPGDTVYVSSVLYSMLDPSCQWSTDNYDIVSFSWTPPIISRVGINIIVVLTTDDGTIT